jgi:hypothetical protein
VDAGCGLLLARVAPDAAPLHDERVRVFRPLPLFRCESRKPCAREGEFAEPRASRADTIVQRGLQPEEFRGFFAHSLEALRAPQGGSFGAAGPAALYDALAAAGVMRR